jgi:hypothetical protein
MRANTRLLLTLVGAALLTGCGRAPGSVPRGPIPANGPGGTPSISAVAPDDPGIFKEDTRRARHWSDDAVRVLAIHSTGLGLGLLQVSASANVFFSPNRFHDYKPSVFVARHYGLRAIAQYGAMPDYARLVASLKPLEGPTPVSAKIAFNIARQSPGQASCPPGTTCPPNAQRSFSLSRAILLNPSNEGPVWWFYTGKKKLTIDASTREVASSAPQVDPNDSLASGLDVDLQRAAAIFLPMNPNQANERTEPQ